MLAEVVDRACLQMMQAGKEHLETRLQDAASGHAAAEQNAAGLRHELAQLRASQQAVASQHQ